MVRIMCDQVTQKPSDVRPEPLDPAIPGRGAADDYA